MGVTEEGKELEGKVLEEVPTGEVSVDSQEPAKRRRGRPSTKKTEQDTATPTSAEKKRGRKPVAKTAVAKKTASRQKKSVEETQTEPKTSRTAGRRATKKADTMPNVVYQYGGISIASRDIVEAAKRAWSDSFERDVDSIGKLDVYVKPEDGKAYYVVDERDMGEIDLWSL